MQSDVISIRDLKLQLTGRVLLDIPALSVRGGERVALVGPNGAGKSSLLKVLGGSEPVTQGTVTVLERHWGGQNLPPLSRSQWRNLRAEVGQVMQGLHLVARLSALENTVLGALGRPGALPVWRSWLRWYPTDLYEEARCALADLGLEHRLQSRADQLSGGERQKVSLARLRLQRPRLILADEPTSALDPAATRQACQALLSVASHATLMTVVHDPALLPLLADRVIGLKDGKMVFDIAVGDLEPSILNDLYEDRRHPCPNNPTDSARSHLSDRVPLRTHRVPPACPSAIG